MSSNTTLIALRTGTTAAITALAAVYAYYPHMTWVMPVLAAASALGIHAIPSVSQSTRATGPAVMKGNIMPENQPVPAIDGSVLMGLTPAASETAPAVSEPVPASEPAPVTAERTAPVDPAGPAASVPEPKAAVLGALDALREAVSRL